MLGKVLKEGEEKKKKITKVGSDLKKILPIMVAPGCANQELGGRLEAGFQRQQAGLGGAGTLLRAYHSSASALPAVRSG